MRVVTSAIVLAFALAACGEISHYREAEQPLGAVLQAGVGDVLLHVRKERDLENVHGKADLYGRKTNEGFIEIRYLGLEAPKTAVFSRREVTIVNYETTVTRMGGIYVPSRSTTTMTGTVGSTPVRATASTTGGTFVPVEGATPIVVPEDSLAIRVDLANIQSVPVAGYTVTILEANAASVTYRIDPGIQPTG